MIIDEKNLDNHIFGDSPYGFYANYSDEELIKNKSHIEEIHFEWSSSITFYNNISQFQNLKKIKINLDVCGFQILPFEIKEIKKLECIHLYSKNSGWARDLENENTTNFFNHLKGLSNLKAIIIGDRILDKDNLNTTKFISQLSNIPCLETIIISKGNSYFKLTEGFSRLTSLKKLIIESYVDSESFYHLKNLENLEILSLSDFITTDVLNTLTNLKHLRCMFVPIEVNHQSLQLKQIKSIEINDISRNKNTFPKQTYLEFIKELSHLEYFKFREFSAVERLEINDEVFEKLINLKTLILSFSDRSGNLNISNLVNLEKLEINFSGWDHVLNVILSKDLEYLSEIHLNNSHIPTSSLSIPENILNYFPNVKSIHIKHNQLKVPKNLYKLENLELSSCDISNVENIYTYFNLKKLDLSCCFTESLSKEISNLKNIEDLNVSVNGLKEIPNEISELKKLKKLHLWGNPLDRLPNSICKIIPNKLDTQNTVYGLEYLSLPKREHSGENFYANIPKCVSVFLEQLNSEHYHDDDQQENNQMTMEDFLGGENPYYSDTDFCD